MTTLTHHEALKLVYTAITTDLVTRENSPDEIKRAVYRTALADALRGSNRRYSEYREISAVVLGAVEDHTTYNLITDMIRAACAKTDPVPA